MADYTKILGAGAIAALLAATPVLADFHEEWDGDADGALSEEEFGAGFGERGVFGSWDGDGDGLLSQDEYGAGYGEDYDEAGFTESDADADGFLSEEEFGSSVFGGYDADGSGIIEEPELGDVGDDIGDGGLFDI